ncbi:MAG: phenylacetate-CoA oxygenase subunit PaaC [Candidatus Pseudobacter hemicellulosilyticus]|uniref:Phenylacetate-CoA oxygenase subunit PaaC n=1 Tax=Candidatus Pseudobacter hemicellulosilyticus TaxID=3121375 RepID=A0AAJ5WV18_9BACT|nr:MAG: phenylacetate-CoA oxygenase subunit PaaC [Pseudobacter sp.]
MEQQTITNYSIYLADNALILAQRNSEWCGHGPVLEQDIALTNITLDLVGQARSLYQYAAGLLGNGATEDSLAYLRDARAYTNCLLAELPNGDWGQTILRQFFFSAWQYLLYEKLQRSADTTLAAIAEKSLKEVTYHLRWSSEWVIRLGDGTEESQQRMCEALETLWSFTGELFLPAPFENAASAEGAGIDAASLKAPWLARVQEVLAEATLPLPDEKAWMQTGGKEGKHTEHLGFLLADLQFLQRAYPHSTW